MTKRIIFHIPYKPDRNRASASQIRPFKMIDAFRELGFNVDIVMGTAYERSKQIDNIKENIKNGIMYDFLYSESSTMPTLLSEKHHLPSFPFLDFGFWKYCKRHGIPIGLFYRDIHWRFSHYDNQLTRLKKIYALFFFKYDLLIYKRLISSLYLPSTEMLSYIPELAAIPTVPLPPGTDIVQHMNIDSNVVRENIKFLYVGGLGDLYDLKLFLKGIESSGYSKLKVTICCRKDDFEKVKLQYDELLNNDHIAIVHVQGDDLPKLYRTHDICCLFVKPTEYWDFAMPVKLFEYISYRKPILAVKSTAVGDFVEREKIGWSLPYNAESLAAWLSQLDLANPNFLDIEKQLKEVSDKNSWKSRARTVMNSLISNPLANED